MQTDRRTYKIPKWESDQGKHLIKRENPTRWSLIMLCLAGSVMIFFSSSLSSSSGRLNSYWTDFPWRGEGEIAGIYSLLDLDMVSGPISDWKSSTVRLALLLFS